MLTTLVIASLLAADDAPTRSARLLDPPQTEVTRPRLWPPLVATLGGAVAAVTGLGLVWTGVWLGYWYAFSFAVASVALVTAGVVIFALAVPLTVIGAIKLRHAVRARREAEPAPLPEDGPPLVTIATF